MSVILSVYQQRMICSMKLLNVCFLSLIWNTETSPGFWKGESVKGGSVQFRSRARLKNTSMHEGRTQPEETMLEMQWVCKMIGFCICSPLAQHHDCCVSAVTDPISPSDSVLLPAAEPLSNSCWKVPELLLDPRNSFIWGQVCLWKTSKTFMLLFIWIDKGTVVLLLLAAKDGNMVQIKFSIRLPQNFCGTATV